MLCRRLTVPFIPNALKLEQKKAIHEENFERAAQLRDEIHKLEEAHKEAKEARKDHKESA